MGANTVTNASFKRQVRPGSYVQERPLGGADTSHISLSSSWTEVVRVQPAERDFQYQLNPAWLPSMFRQLKTLVALPRDWDGYGGTPMSADAARKFGEFIRDYTQYIRSAPLLSLTAEGGILARWTSPDSEIDLYFETDEVEVVFETHIDSHEESGPAASFPQLAKWLWQASAPH
jgi:hypothetical protein